MINKNIFYSVYNVYCIFICTNTLLYMYTVTVYSPAI